MNYITLSQNEKLLGAAVGKKILIWDNPLYKEVVLEYYKRQQKKRGLDGPVTIGLIGAQYSGPSL